MRIKDFTDTIRHLTDPFNIPQARRMIAENPALTQEQFKAGGIVEPGVTHYARKSIWDPPRKSAREILGETDPERLSRMDMSGKVHDTAADAIAADKKRLYPEGQKSPKSLAKGIKKLPDGKYSVRSKYKADLGNWPDGTKKAKTHYFKKYEDAVAFKKEAIEQPKKAIESAQQVQKTRSEWVKKFYTDNIDKFDDYDSFLNQMKEDWAAESKKPKYIDIEKRVRLSDDIGLPLLGDIETEISGLKAPKKGQVSTHAPSQSFYKKAFLKGKGLEKIPSEYKKEKIKFRKELDPADIKGKVRRDVLPVGSGIEQHHLYPKRYGETLETLMPTTSELNVMGTRERFIAAIDNFKEGIEKSNLSPLEKQKQLDRWQAVENRIVKGKSIAGIKLPPVIGTGTNWRTVVKANDPRLTGKPWIDDKLYITEDRFFDNLSKRKGMVGYGKAVVSPEGEITHTLKGASKKKSFAGLSEEPLTKVLFSDVEKGSATKARIVEKMIEGFIDSGIGSGCKRGVVPKAAAQGGRIGMATADAGLVSCVTGHLNQTMKQAQKAGTMGNAAKTKILKAGKALMRWGIPIDIAIEGAFAYNNYLKGDTKQEAFEQTLFGLLTPKTNYESLTRDRLKEIGGKELGRYFADKNKLKKLNWTFESIAAEEADPLGTPEKIEEAKKAYETKTRGLDWRTVESTMPTSPYYPRKSETFTTPEGRKITSLGPEDLYPMEALRTKPGSPLVEAKGRAEEVDQMRRFETQMERNYGENWRDKLGETRTVGRYKTKMPLTNLNIIKKKAGVFDERIDLADKYQDYRDWYNHPDQDVYQFTEKDIEKRRSKDLIDLLASWGGASKYAAGGRVSYLDGGIASLKKK